MPPNSKVSLWLSTCAIVLSGAAVLIGLRGHAVVKPDDVEAAFMAKPTIILEALQKMQAAQGPQLSKAYLANIDRNASASFEVGPDHVLGNPHGRKVIAEFLDPQCPHCRDAAPGIAEAVKNTPELKIVLHDLPVINQASVVAAAASAAAEAQGRFMEMHQALMETPLPFTAASIDEAATRAGVDVAKMHEFMASPATLAGLRQGRELAESVGADATPVFVVKGIGTVKGFTTAQQFASFVAQIPEP